MAETQIEPVGHWTSSEVEIRISKSGKGGVVIVGGKVLMVTILSVEASADSWSKVRLELPMLSAKVSVVDVATRGDLPPPPRRPVVPDVRRAGRT